MPHSQYAVQIGDSTKCSFHYSNAAQPKVFRVSPESGVSGDTISIFGEGLGETIEDNEVFLGSTPCEVVQGGASEVRCVVQRSLAGEQPLRMRVPSRGWTNATYESDSPVVFSYRLAISDISPEQGSLGGGTYVTLTGDGFAIYQSSAESEANDVDMRVFLGEQLCLVRWSNRTTINCISGPGTEATVDVTVSINSSRANMAEETSHTESSAFTYSNAITPLVVSVSPAQVGGGGGTTLTLTGEGFPADTQNLSVKVIFACLFDVQPLMFFPRNAFLSCWR